MSERKKMFMSARGSPAVLGLNHDDAEESSRKPLQRVRLLFPDEKAHGCARKSVGRADLVLEEAKIRSGDILRMADEECKDRRVDRDLGHERGGRDLRGLPFAGRQGMNGENILEELIELSGRDAG